ncbi:hypothetical protein ACFWP2_04645 [Kitasatospora sp. NPDC058444]|uniref:hypothetical protein n=1 Tax=Kitasatospora sp. NPDC058444 TaxID=3346504 RepID=UPI0036678160
MASPGYGKQSAPGQLPPAADDFAHLPAREAYLASLINRLPDGAAMDVKTLAAHQPLFGQMACRTALNRLSAAGHLRRVRERVNAERPQWVFRTYFSRTPRSDAWWNHFLATGEARDAGEASTDSAPDPPEEGIRNRTSPVSAAYAALAGLGLADTRLSLSAADCEALEPLAAEWFERGTTPALFTAALTAGLPTPVHSPAAFTRRRLLDKLPPVRPRPDPAVARIPECTACRTPCRPPALLGGLCHACRGTPATPPSHRRLSPATVHQHAARARDALRSHNSPTAPAR